VKSGTPKSSVVTAALARYQDRNKQRRQSPYRRTLVKAIDELGSNAYVHMIVQHLASADPPLRTTPGAVHATLRRMEKAGLLTSTIAPSPIPDARNVVIYQVTPLGQETYAD
jgi:DNA-binding PadR family transcriptional regulator